MCWDVMVVEDDADIRETLHEVLTERGHTVHDAANGAEALAYLRSRAPEDEPCLMLVDLMMPVMSGAELVEAMQDNDVLSSIPVVMTTGSRGAVPRAPNVVRVLPKPFSLDALFALVEEHCPVTALPTSSPAG